MRLQPCDETLEVVRRHRLLGDDDLLAARHPCDRIEGRPQVVRQIEGCAIDDVRAPVAADQRVAIGRGARDPADADASGGAGDVFDDDRLPERAPHPFGDDAGNEVGAAARRERHDHGDRPRRIGLSGGARDAAERGGDSTHICRDGEIPQPTAQSGQAQQEGPGAADAFQGASAGLRADRSGAGAAAQSRHRKGHRRDGLGNHRPAAAAGQFVRAPRRPAQRAHRAQVDRAKGFDEAPQRGYVARAPLDINAELANALGYGQGDPNKSLIGDTAGEPPEPRDEISDISEPRREKRVMHRPTPQPITLGVTASMEALDKLLREGRPEFAASGGTAVWTPHRPPRPEKSEGGVRIELKSELTPKGDQPTAIKDLVEGARRHDRTQVLLGVTGSGKTFTMAKVIEATQRPALILAPNKTLAAQLYGEFKSFFPDNAVEYFVSYYDYYQPEAYIPRTDTYIEKDSSINEQIDRMRHSATRALLERDDVIIVASVSCIYGIGSVETYSAMTFTIKKGEKIDQRQLIADLVATQYKRTSADFSRGTFRVRGDVVDIFPAHYEDRAWRVNLFGDEVESIHEFDPLTGHKTDELEFVKIYANSHYVTPRPTLIQAISGIKAELKWRLDELHNSGRLLEAQRLEQRTLFDLEDDGGDRRLRRHRELFALSDRAQTRRAAADAVRIRARQRAGVRRREPRHRAADRRHVPRRLPPQGDARRIRLPPAVLHGQPAAALRGMGRDAAADRRRLGDARPVGDERGRRRVRRAGDPPDRADRSAGRGAAGAHPGRRPGRRGARDRAPGLPLAGHRADQAHGRGPHRIPARAGHPGALHALRHRHHGAHRDHPRSAARRVRRAGRHQPAARGPRHSRNARWSPSSTPTRKASCAARRR